MVHFGLGLLMLLLHVMVHLALGLHALEDLLQLAEVSAAACRCYAAGHVTTLTTDSVMTGPWHAGITSRQGCRTTSSAVIGCRKPIMIGSCASRSTSPITTAHGLQTGAPSVTPEAVRFYIENLELVKCSKVSTRLHARSYAGAFTICFIGVQHVAAGSWSALIVANPRLLP